MGSELAACPVCGGECKLLNDNDGAYCVSPDCGHYEVLPVEMHNTLARRAEVGALVERIVDGLGYVQMECEADANGEAGMYDVRSHDASAYTDTLLDALRALAKECQLPEKP